MTLSKATSAEWAACSAGSSRFGFSLSSGFFAGTAPSLSALLGWCAEAVPSGATSAIRYQKPERIGFVARVVAELEFAGVERQIGFADLVEIADDAAFDQRPEAFDVLRVHRADDVLLMGMGDHLMRVFAVQPVIADPFVGDEQRHPVGNDLAHEAFEGRAVNAVDDAGNDLALAADRADERLLAGAKAATTGAATVADVPVLGLAADEGFIDLDLAEQLALGAVLHRDPNAMAHVPGGLVGA